MDEVYAVQVALDVAAPDAESWMNGLAAYVNGHGIRAALDASAPDQESWLMGMGAYQGVLRITPQGVARPFQGNLGGRIFRPDQFSPAQHRRAMA